MHGKKKTHVLRFVYGFPGDRKSPIVSNKHTEEPVAGSNKHPFQNNSHPMHANVTVLEGQGT